ncbi:MAG: sulfatase [Rhodospirillales bacterium]|nr:sulfatase [Rhodospirillales bacterium]
MPFYQTTRRVMCVAVALCFCLCSVHAQQPKPQIRNVLFIVSDDLRADALGCYGNSICMTPNIDKLADTGIVFDRAYCQGTWCLPSRTSFMFSRYKGQAGVNVAQYFKQHGYYSARVGKIFHMRVPGDIIDGTDGRDVPESWTQRFNSQGNEAHTAGDYACLNLNIFTDKLEGRQSTGMPHRAYVTVKYEGDGSDQPDHKTATKTIELLREHRDKPFFIATGFVRPHYPMVAPTQYFEPYPWQKMQMPKQVENDLADIPKMGYGQSRSSTNGLEKYPDNQKRMWAGYLATVTFMDEQVGRILDELDRLGLRENTVVIFTSDHGYNLGDHTFWQKVDLHEPVIRVPLVIAAPGYKPGRSRSIVELIDLYPTLTQLAGLPPAEGVQGNSLVPILEDPKASVNEGALAYTGKGYAWRTEGWAYMRYRDGSEELYDMKADPGQITNLAKDAKYAGHLERMRAGLEARLKEAGL